jgi:hypothetical protein
VLADDVQPAQYYDFVDMLDDDELGRFSLHNGVSLSFDPFVLTLFNTLRLSGGDDDESLIDGKWESLALVPAMDESNPNDYFLFVGVSASHCSLESSYL